MANNHNNQIQLDEIFSPSLHPAGLSTGLDEAFEKINSNFLTLANHDFVKGDIGLSVRIVDEPFVNENNEPNVFAQKLKKCIESVSSPAERADISHNDTTITLWDNFDANPGTIQIIYNDNRWLDLKSEQEASIESPDDEFNMNVFGTEDEEIPIPISSMYYIFLDGRFVNDKLGEIDPMQFANIKDLSCILLYDPKATSGLYEDAEGDGAFTVLANAFPTVYYQNNVGLCWKINGRETGMPIQGVSGKHGENSRLYIVRCNELNTSGAILSGDVNQIFDAYEGWCSLSPDDIEELNDKTALIFSPAKNVNDANSCFYFGHLRVEKNMVNDVEEKKVIGVCGQLTNINYGVEIQSVIDAMKSINLYNSGSSTGSEGLKGLFIPINTTDAHLISSTSLTTDRNVLPNNDLIITPIANISEPIINPEHLIVERYLYLRINRPKDQGIFNDLNAVNNVLKYGDCEKNNFVLKYKLDTAYCNTDANNAATTELSNRYCIGYGYYSDETQTDYMNEAIHLTTDNIGYYKVNSDGSVDSSTVVQSPIVSLPWDIQERLYPGTAKYGFPIYKWTLCNVANDFDVDELLSVSGGVNDYGFPDAFRHVYTSTLTPGATTKFAWHNGLQIVDDGYFGINDYMNDGGKRGSLYTVPGYYIDNEPLLSFIKYVPVFENTHKIDKIDPTLNINYNVTITGDKSNSKTGLTVHGLVNCENLTSEIIAATGEFKNIYTRDNIIDDAGIKIGKTDKNLTGYSCIIDDSGNINTDGNIVTPKISVNNVHTNSVLTKNLTSDNININNAKGEKRLFIGDGITQTIDKNEIISTTISVGNVNDIDIKRVDGIIPAKKLSDNLTQPLISSGVPSLHSNNSNIIVSNQVKGSEHLYYPGTFGCPNTKNDNGVYIGGPGRGATGATTKASSTGTQNDDLKHLRTPDFDHVKNYNMYKLQGSGPVGISYSNKSYSYDVATYDNSNIGFSKWTSSNKYEDYIGASVANDFYTDINTDINSSDYEKFYMAKFELKNNKAGNTDEFNKLKRNIPIKFTFNNDYVFRLCLQNKCSNGRWPVLWINSFLTLKVFYKIGASNAVNIESLNKNITFDGNTSHPTYGKHGNPCNTTNDDSGYEWKGFDADGKYIGSNLENEWRYFVYKFRPSQFVLDVNDNNFNEIADAYDNGDTIVFYIVPSLHLHACGQKRAGTTRKTVKGYALSNFIPVKTFSNSSPEYSKNVDNTDLIYNVQNLFTKQTLGVNVPDRSYPIGQKELLCTQDDQFAVMYYDYDYFKSGDSIKSTTICEDGVVMRAGQYTFGLGQCAYVAKGTNIENTGTDTYVSDKYRQNVPVLFYYKNHDGSDTEPKIDFDGVNIPVGAENPQDFDHEKSLQFYADHAGCIPLDDILNVVKFVKTLCSDNEININDPESWGKCKLDYTKPEDNPA